MSNLWSGRTCWAAVVALLINQVSANPAIITTDTEAGYYDVSLSIKQIDLLPGLYDWDDLAFTSLQAPRFSEYNGSLSTDAWEKLAVLDIASGQLCEFTDGCLDDIAGHYQSLVDAESQEDQDKVKRVFRYISSWLNTGWRTSNSHSITPTALGALSSVVAGTTATIIQLSRSAICGTDAQGNQACLSWSGGAQAIKQNIASEILSNAGGAFGDLAVSAQEYSALFESTSSKKRSLMRFEKRQSDDVCVSNRPDGCT